MRVDRRRLHTCRSGRAAVQGDSSSSRAIGRRRAEGSSQGFDYNMFLLQQRGKNVLPVIMAFLCTFAHTHTHKESITSASRHSSCIVAVLVVCEKKGSKNIAHFLFAFQAIFSLKKLCPCRPPPPLLSLLFGRRTEDTQIENHVWAILSA